MHDVPMSHVTDEELLLDYYGESTAADRVRVSAHLAVCDACRALDHELRGVLALVDRAPLPDAPDGFERDVWARLQQRLESRPSWTWTSWLAVPSWALAGGAALLIVGAFSVGHFWRGPSETVVRDRTVDANQIRERLLRSEVGDHLERSQRMLVELVNADLSGTGPIAREQATAADLVAYGRLYRRSAESTGEAALGELLEDLERVLVEVANGPPDTTPQELSDLRTRINEQDLVFRLRVVAAELRERERKQSAW
jgi:hypothetical protein